MSLSESVSQISNGLEGNFSTVAKASPVAEKIFKMLNKRAKSRNPEYQKTLDLNKFEQGLLDEGVQFDQGEMVKTFQQMQSAGIGSLVVGRGLEHSRFIFNYSLKNVCEAARKGVSIQDILKKNEPKQVMYPEGTKLTKSGTPDKRVKNPGRPKIKASSKKEVKAKGRKALPRKLDGTIDRRFGNSNAGRPAKKTAKADVIAPQAQAMNLNDDFVLIRVPKKDLAKYIR